MSVSVWKKLFAPPDSRERFVTTSAGKVWTVRYGVGRETPLVIVHGGPGFPHNYLLPLRDLSSSRPVIFYDQLGCGRSHAERPTGGWNAQYFVNELCAVIDATAPAGAHVLGHSWGALVAAEAAAAGAPIRSLILASPYLSTSRWRSDAAVRRASLAPEIRRALDLGDEADEPSVAYLAATEEYYRRFVHGSHVHHEFVRAAKDHAGRDVYQQLWGPNEFTVRGKLKDYEIGERLNRITAPVLYTAGRNDEILPETLEQFAAETPRASTKIFELSAHHPHLSEQREYAAAIDEFLLSVEAP